MNTTIRRALAGAVAAVALAGGTIALTDVPAQATTSHHKHHVTHAEKQAKGMAKDYLKYMAFSRNGLVDQLKYEGFSTHDARYGADHAGANWNHQATRVAKSYLNYMHFSRSGLIEQLQYEGFSHSQALYGVKHAGL
jgi:hypothetical protein